MARYNYDKSVLSGLSTKAFMKEVEVRNRHIEAASDCMPPSDYAVNSVSRELHPHMQFVKIAKVQPYAGGIQYTLVADSEKGTNELALFRPGQFITIALEMDGVPTTRTYHLCGSPTQALGPDGSYTIMVNEIPGRTACFWIHEHWSVGTELLISGPLGHLYHQSLRDGKHLLRIGTNGVFYSMGRAIAERVLDADLTIIYPMFVFDEFIAEQEKQIIEASKGRVKIVPVMYSAPDAPQPEQLPEGVVAGPITADLIRGELGQNIESTAAFLDCAPQFIEPTMAALLGAGVPAYRIHREYDGALDSPAEDPAYPLDPTSDEAKFTAIVHARNARYTVACGGTETLLQSMENAGISVPSDCRSGSCGWCHSRLISGEVFVPESKDGRREADKKFGWIHPCCTYPLSNVELEIFPLVNPD